MQNERGNPFTALPVRHFSGGPTPFLKELVCQLSEENKLSRNSGIAMDNDLKCLVQKRNDVNDSLALTVDEVIEIDDRRVGFFFYEIVELPERRSGGAESGRRTGATGEPVAGAGIGRGDGRRRRRGPHGRRGRDPGRPVRPPRRLAAGHPRQISASAVPPNFGSTRTFLSGFSL